MSTEESLATEEKVKSAKADKCKYCGANLTKFDVHTVAKKFLGLRQMAFGGVENQYLRIATVQCPNKPKCGKRYTHRAKVTEYYYK